MSRPVPHRRSPLATFALLSCVCALLAGCATTRPTDPFAAQQIAAAQPVTALQPGAVLVPAAALPGITIFPGRLVAPIGNEVLVVATVNTAEKSQAPYQRVEWILAPQGVGSFLATGESDRPFFASGRDPEKLDNGYLISETAATGHVLQRGTATPADDVTILSGQAWLTITSPTEGVSYVTAYAPDLQGAYGNRQTAAVHWVDARWTLPPQIDARVGGSAPLAVSVYRQSSGLPVANWRVRFSISGGPPGNFSAGGAQTFEATTNAAGQAIADLTQATPQPGTNTITVELVRPDTVPGATEPLIVGTATTQVVWSETGPISPAPITPGGTIPIDPIPGGQSIPVVPPPQPGTTPPATTNSIRLNLSGPTSVAAGQEVKFQLEITNTGTNPIDQAVVNVEFDPGLTSKLGASPVRRVFNDPIPSGQPSIILLPFTATRSGQQCVNVTVSALTGAPVQARACLNVVGATPGIDALPKFTLKITPSTRQAPLGSEPQFVIELENTSNEPINDLQLTAEFAPELPPASSSPQYSGPEYKLNFNAQNQTISWSGFKLPANGKLTPPLVIQTQKLSKLTPPNKPAYVRVTAKVNGLPLSQETTVEVIPPQAAAPTAGSRLDLGFSKNANGQQIKVGTPYRYSFLINNIGSAPDRNVQLVVKLPDQVQLVPNGINVEAQISGQVITFAPIPELGPTTGNPPQDRPRQITIDVIARQAGNGSLEAKLSSSTQTQPQQKSDPVNFY